MVGDQYLLEQIKPWLVKKLRNHVEDATTWPGGWVRWVWPYPGSVDVLLQLGFLDRGEGKCYRCADTHKTSGLPITERLTGTDMRPPCDHNKITEVHITPLGKQFLLDAKEQEEWPVCYYCGKRTESNVVWEIVNEQNCCTSCVDKMFAQDQKESEEQL